MKSMIVMTAAALLVAGCASTTNAGAQRESEQERLARECQARGGILMPIPGANNANEAANYACEIRGPTSRTTRN